MVTADRRVKEKEKKKIIGQDLLTLSSNPWNKIIGQENLSAKLIGDLS